MASIKALTQALHRLREDLARMRAQVALTPTLLGDPQSRTRTTDGSDGSDGQARTAAAFRKLLV